MLWRVTRLKLGKRVFPDNDGVIHHDTEGHHHADHADEVDAATKGVKYRQRAQE